ncbi:MAG TPA: hypothetical protein VF035_00875 [Longimicrobiales bacterium]
MSSAAAPGASVAELVSACSARGLSALEIVVGHEDVYQLAREIVASLDHGVRISGLLSHDSDDAPSLSALARVTATPVIVADACELSERIERVRAITSRGGEALVLVRGPVEKWLETVIATQVRFAWQVDATCAHPADDATRILGRAGIEYVRLVGGGPESAMQEGKGIGALMRTLTVACYDAPLILTPSSPSYRVAWAAWLGRRGGWGCGSKAGNQAVIPIHSGSA